MKKLFAGLAVAGLAATSFGLMANEAQACHPSSTQNAPSTGGEDVVALPNGTTVYKSQGVGGTSGFVGVKGGTGYIEANGSATSQSGHIRGKTNDGTLNGRIQGSPSGVSVCMNDVKVP